MTDYVKLTDYAAKDNLLTGNPSKVVRGTEIGADLDAIVTMSATKGDKATALSQFAATTSAQLAGVISDETGSGALVFATSPTLVTPILGTPTSGVTDNLTTTTTATAIVDTDFVDTNLAAGGKRKILWTAVKTYLTSTFSTLAQLAASGGAALIGNTPAGSIAATTVQAAINELDTEKAALAGSASQTFSVAAATAAAHAVRADGVMGRNKILNGRFQINQRVYVSAATLAAGVYGHDRFKAGASGGDYSFTQNAADTTITIAASKSLIQVIEDVNVSDTAYVLSWSGTAQARYAVNSATPAGSYAASPILITGQTVGTVMSVEFNTGTLGDIQLEAGTIATVYEARHYGTELALCQRYYEIGGSGSVGTAYSITNAAAYTGNINWAFRVTKRSVPTIGYVGSTFTINDSGIGNAIADSAIAIAAQSETVNGASINIAGTCSATHTYISYHVHGLLTDFLTASAEL